MSAPTTEQCRLTVIGPARRVDLSVPMSATVASLLPVLARHTTEGDPEQVGSWALQRLGEAPLAPDATVATADLVEGEELYLRPAQDPLPELDFDDVADGLATAMSRKSDRWRPELNRPFFLSIAALVTATAAVPLVTAGSAAAGRTTAFVIAVLLLTASVLAGRRLGDRTLATMAGLGGCLFVAVAGAVGSVGIDMVLPACVGAAVAGGILLALRTVAAGLISIPIFAAVVLVSGLLVLGVVLSDVAGLGSLKAAAVLAVMVLVLVIVAPRFAIRAARVRGPQLPRTADELQVDIEPEPADSLLARAAVADSYVSVVTVSATVVTSACFLVLLTSPKWVAVALVVTISSAYLLRARIFQATWQRIPLTLTGLAGFIALVLNWAGTSSAPWRLVVLVAVFAVVGSLVLAALRAPFRRLVPIWGHLANILETITSLLIVPFLLQMLGMFGWARGLWG